MRAFRSYKRNSWWRVFIFTIIGWRPVNLHWGSLMYRENDGKQKMKIRMNAYLARQREKP